MKRMVLIHPYPRKKHFGEENVSVIVQMPLSLGYISALTPGQEWQVEYVDECIEEALDAQGNLTFGKADLVGITGLTYQIPRAYQIAQACRRQGIPTVLGGAHSTILPEEAAQYADSVVVGEAEVVWSQFLKDFQQGRTRQFYNGGPTPLEQLKGVIPDREGLGKKYGYKYSSIITTRGCPFNCDFCCVPNIQGKRYRERPPEDVWEELAYTRYKGLMLAEDNFYGYTPKAQERCRKLMKGWAEREFQKDWFGFTSLNVTQDEEFLKYMAQSGGIGMLMGIESIDYDTLRQMHKSVNVGIAKKQFDLSKQGFIQAYKSSFENVHKHGMIVWGSVIFGSDFDTESVFQDIVDLVWESKMDICTFGIYTPMARTELHKRLSAESRIFRDNYPEDWFYYNSEHLVFQLKSMSLERFIEGLTFVYNNIYSPEQIRERFKRTYQSNGNLRTAMFAYRTNLDWRLVFQYKIEELKKLLRDGIYPSRANKNLVQIGKPADKVKNHPQRAKLAALARKEAR